MSLKITKACPICDKLDTVKVVPCCHEDTCSIDYTVQCMGECVAVRGKWGFYSPTLFHHTKTKRAATIAWNNGEIDINSMIYWSGENYMGD